MLVAFHEVGGAFRVVNHFATVTWATARSGQHLCGLWIVGLLHAPSLALQFRLVMILRACEGLPVQARLGVGSTNGPALMTFASPTKTLSSMRRPVSLLSVGRRALRLSALRLPGRRTPLLGLSKFAPPSASAPGVHSQRSPAPKSCFRVPPRKEVPSGAGCLRPGVATSRTRSALAVPPGCGGLLHLVPFRFVAP